MRKLAAIGEMLHAAELSAEGVDVLPCPKLTAPPEARADPLSRGNATWSCYLAEAGLMRAATLRQSLIFWRDLLLREKVTLLVADYAPLRSGRHWRCARTGTRSASWSPAPATASRPPACRPCRILRAATTG
ncbi:hypothetical protein MASR1M32_30790 [Rhodobacter sp.]